MSAVDQTKTFGAAFLPATFQGTQFRQGDVPILNLKPADSSDERQRNKLAFLKQMNEQWGADKQDDSELDARVRSYELAYQMQSAGPEAVDLQTP